MSIHVIPTNDDIEHIKGPDCPCRPTVEWEDPVLGGIYPNGPLVTHRASDCREVSERVTGEGVSEDLKWEVHEV